MPDEIDSLMPITAEQIKGSVITPRIVIFRDLLQCDFHPDENAVSMSVVNLDEGSTAIVTYGRSKLKEIQKDTDKELDEAVDEHTGDVMMQRKEENPDELQVVDVDDINTIETRLGVDVVAICEDCEKAYDNHRVESCFECNSENVVQHEKM